MRLFVLGVNHKTAPVSVREQISFAPEQINDAVVELNAISGVRANLIVSTCNRTELYIAIEAERINSELLQFYEQQKFQISNNSEAYMTQGSVKNTSNANLEPSLPVWEVEHNEILNTRILQSIISWLCFFHSVDKMALIDHLFIYQDSEAVRHLMRVASGLDSLVVGEPQILGQVKQAYFHAKALYTMPLRFSKWIEKSFSVAKRVRTETDIGANAVSVAFAACSLARQIFENLSELNVLLIGAGETIELVSRHLKTQGVKNIFFTNRTKSRAEAIAYPINGKVFELSELADEISKADIVISSTASPLPLVSLEMIKVALKQRRYQPMLLIDIAVPRDIDPMVSELDSVYLYTVDDLEHIIEQNQSQRLNAAKQAEKLILSEVELFMQWINLQYATNVVVEYRESAERIREELLVKAKSAISNGADPLLELEKLSRKLTNKLIHPPTIALKKSTQFEDKGYFSRLSDELKFTPP